MELDLITFLIVCPLVFLAGFIDAIAGGGGLVSLPAYMIAGLPAHNAIATNKLSSSMGTTVSTIRLSLASQIPWKVVWIYVLCALAGSSGGAQLALLLPERIFKIIMLFIIPFTALYLLFFKPTAKEKPSLSPKQTILRAALTALLIGLYDGFYGPGTGTFLILLLTAFAHYKLGEANGISKAVNLSSNTAALVVYLFHGRGWLVLGLIAGLCNMLGNYIGISFFKKKGSRIVLPLMLTVLAVFFVRVLYELFFKQ
ncbi:MAG: sulfite exporter TauE/SafE family protein [Lachnospiraceae bacterium]|nr:sulfite exporter TauE/SafE family protein [Lachnospiraceae bacterium]